MQTIALIGAYLIGWANAQEACPSDDPKGPMQEKTTGEGKTGVERVLTREVFNQLFTGRLTRPDTCTGIGKFEYDGFVAAASMFPEFANSGDWNTDALEVASFLAMHSQETSGGWDQAPCGQFAWGACFVEEQGCAASGCPGYSSGYQNCMAEYGFSCDPVEGHGYYGRGAIQLSYPSNYALFSKDFFGDETILLNNPEQVSENATMAYASGLWFWMKEQKPKDSCHDVITGKKTYNRDGNQGGFGLCTMIINGGVECTTCTEDDKAKHRYEFLQRYTFLMNVPLCRRPNDVVGCAGTASYDNVANWDSLAQQCTIDHSLCEKSNIETCPDLDGTIMGLTSPGTCDGWTGQGVSVPDATPTTAPGGSSATGGAGGNTIPGSSSAASSGAAPSGAGAKILASAAGGLLWLLTMD